jgi:hypothetical protein
MGKLSKRRSSLFTAAPLKGRGKEKVMVWLRVKLSESARAEPRLKARRHRRRVRRMMASPTRGVTVECVSAGAESSEGTWRVT